MIDDRWPMADEHIMAEILCVFVGFISHKDTKNLRYQRASSGQQTTDNKQLALRTSAIDNHNL
ncbi:MAG: hypothetical protein EOO01_33140 [Chitinophagaceae bacterium]|nr:MAG: hypothetical protein EOO01_33140 [Chitinophagaceae bacterium]